MANKRTGAFVITNTGTHNGTAVTGVTGEYTGVAGQTIATDIAVDDYLFASAGVGFLRWRVTAVTAATATEATINVELDDPVSTPPASSPIAFGGAAITEPITPGGASSVPSQSQLQLPESIVQYVNTTNAFYEAGGGDSETVTQNTDRIALLEQNLIQPSELGAIQDFFDVASEHFDANNPHGITAESLGVYTASEVDVIVQEAITSAVAQTRFVASEQLIFDGQATLETSLIFDGQAE